MQIPPEGWHNITPRIFVDQPEELIDFLKQCFDARGDFHPHRPAEITIGDSIVMIAGTDQRPAFNAYLYVYVADVDRTFAKGVAAGAKIVEDPSLMPYGDRRCTLEDKWGNIWQIATRKELLNFSG